ncbi:hypothetical protein AKJ59_00680, partial [candidate division MSBL1 archaeon SCGC-AAA385M02]
VYLNDTGHSTTQGVSRFDTIFYNKSSDTYTHPNKWFDGSSITGFPIDVQSNDCGWNDLNLVKTGCGDMLLHINQACDTGGGWFRNYTHQYRNQSGTIKNWGFNQVIDPVNSDISHQEFMAPTDDMVLDDTIYLPISRDYGSWGHPGFNSYLLNSTDCGHTWYYQSNISEDSSYDMTEVGITYVGGNNFTIVTRVGKNESGDRFTTYQRVSEDRGFTWNPIQDIRDEVGFWHNPVLRNSWKFSGSDYYPIWMVGRYYTNEPTESNAVAEKYSIDSEWDYTVLDEECGDCGYGDFLQLSPDEFKVFNYVAGDDDIREYDVDSVDGVNIEGGVNIESGVNIGG